MKLGKAREAEETFHDINIFSRAKKKKASTECAQSALTVFLNNGDNGNSRVK